MSADMILYILAAICFGLAASRRFTVPVDLVALGLLFWVATNFVGG